MMSRKLVIFAGALLCNAVVSGAMEAEPIKLRYGQNAAFAGSLSSLPLTIAERKGFFVHEGLTLEVVPIPGGTDRIVAGLDKGEIDAGKNATPYLIQAVLKGSDAVAIVAKKISTHWFASCAASRRPLNLSTIPRIMTRSEISSRNR